MCIIRIHTQIHSEWIKLQLFQEPQVCSLVIQTSLRMCHTGAHPDEMQAVLTVLRIIKKVLANGKLLSPSLKINSLQFSHGKYMIAKHQCGIHTNKALNHYMNRTAFSPKTTLRGRCHYNVTDDKGSDAKIPAPPHSRWEVRPASNCVGFLSVPALGIRAYIMCLLFIQLTRDSICQFCYY